MTCLFLYGLVETGRQEDNGAVLRQALSSVPAVDPMDVPRIVAAGQVGAVVSTVPLADFAEPQLQANLENLDWLEPRARAHAEVIHQVFAVQPILPVRFGMLFSTEEHLIATLERIQETLLTALAAIAGQEEWTVRFCGNPAQVLAEQVEAVKPNLRTAGQGAQYLLGRRMTMKGLPEMTARLEAAAEEAHARLTPLALQVSPARTEIGGLPGGKRSLMSRVYLIHQEKRAAFLAELEQVSAALAPDGILPLCSGPWPPAAQVDLSDGNA